ncbi:MAG: S41 family peptidase [Novosphingobium sp.]
MRIDRRTLLAAAPAALATRAMAAAPAPAPPTVAAIKRDFAILSEAYDRLHPGLDRYTGRDRFRHLVQSESVRLVNSPATVRDQFLSLARITAAVRCGHTYPNPANQSKATLAQVVDTSVAVPFTFRWIEGRMVVTSTLRPDVPLRRGDIITAVDGVATTILLRRLMPLARADGSNDAKRLALLGVYDQGSPNPFDIYRPLIAAHDPARRILVSLVDGRTLDMPSLVRLPRARGADRNDAQSNGWSLALSEGIGTLRMDNWGLYDSTWDWKAWLDAAFDRLIEEKIQGLVIDIRANEGGIDCGDAVLARLIDRPLPQAVMERHVRYKKIPDALRPVLDTWDRSFDDWGDAAQRSSREGMYRLVRGDFDLPGAKIEPVGKRFTGKVAVLVGPTCSSATFQFAETVKRNGVAVLVGEPTGGNLRGINGGAFYFLRLPETGLEVDLPLIGFFPSSPQPDAGVTPDIPVQTSARDIASGRDRAMEKARQLVS